MPTRLIVSPSAGGVPQRHWPEGVSLCLVSVEVLPGNNAYCTWAETGTRQADGYTVL